MKQIILLTIILIFSCSLKTTAQQKRGFSEWDTHAFCSYEKYHPHTYINADNNWEIIQALKTPHTRVYLDSLDIKNSDSQMMLLRIEGFIEQKDNGNWVSLIPTLDSLQTIEARTFSAKIANAIYPKIKDDCIFFIDLLNREKYQENAFSILFSYVLDGKIWDSFNSFSDLKSSATWDGECWAFYFPRNFCCGTNSYDELNICWTEREPEFVWDELDYKSFIEPFLSEYRINGKIASLEIHAKALAFGIIDEDGFLKIPIINSKDSDSPINIISDRIIDTIVQYFTDSNIVSYFQDKFQIDQNREKLACTMLYHEVMWDLMDLLIENRIIQLPILWKDMDRKSIYSVVFIIN